jgi:hypothetical protein
LVALSTGSLLPGNHKKKKDTRQGIMVGLIGLKFVLKFQVGVVDKLKDLNPQRNCAGPWLQGWWVDTKTTSLVRKQIARPVYTQMPGYSVSFSPFFTHFNVFGHVPALSALVVPSSS